MTTTTLPSGTGVVSSYAYDNADRLTAVIVLLFTVAEVVRSSTLSGQSWSAYKRRYGNE